MNHTGEASAKQQKLENHLLKLPTVLLEYICQLLIDRAERFDWLTHVRTLRDVMSLRVSCSALNDVIKAMTLYVPCFIDDSLASSPPNLNYVSFVDFMRLETNWRFRSLTIQSEKTLKEKDLIPFLLQNEELFQKSLKKAEFWFTQPDCYEAVGEALFNWLKRTTFDNGPEIEVNFWTLNSTVSAPKIVSKMIIFEYSDGVFPEMLLKYSNLTELSLDGNELEVEKLNFFPNLKFLTVGNLRSLSPSITSTFPVLPTITYLRITFPDENDVQILPKIIEKCFPRLTSFDFSHLGLGLQNTKIDFSHLPSSFKFLGTEPRFLPCFVNCKSIKNLCLYYEGVSDLIKDNRNIATLRILNLEILFRSVCFLSFSDLIYHLTRIFSSFPCLTTFAFKLPIPFFNAETSVLKLFGGDSDFGSARILRSYGELRQLCIERNLQLFTLGKTAFMKKSASQAVLRKINTSERFDVNRTPEITLMLPMELLTEH